MTEQASQNPDQMKPVDENIEKETNAKVGAEADSGSSEKSGKDQSAEFSSDGSKKKPTSRTKKRFSAPKIILIIICAIVVLIAAVLIGFNIYVKSSCSHFYAAAKAEFEMPGLDTDFVPQDLNYNEYTDSWLFSGYMSDESASPIYRRSSEGDVSRIFVLYPDGTIYNGHGSGVTSNFRYVFLTDEVGYLVLDLDKVQNAPDGQYVTARAIVQLDFSPAYINIQHNMLYVGNFYLEDKYETPLAHRVTTSDGSENPAVVYVYPAGNTGLYGFDTRAKYVLSIPERIQGIAVTPDNKIVLSQSYGPSLSHLLVYDVAAVQKSGKEFLADEREVPLYYLDSNGLINDIVIPPMSEGIEYHDGYIYISDEAASSKYKFGALYGAGDVYALPASAL